jgi:dethiobiotin synthetase
VIGVFVTGTDTGCGKTTVAVALCRAARAAGLAVRVLKPVETGCEERDGRLHPADAVALALAAGDDSPLERLCPYRLRLPAAPQVAASCEGIEIDPERIEKALAEAARGADLVVVEGAGGLRVPIRQGLDMAGLAARLGLPLLVVARARLGTINHTLLTLDAAATRGLRVAGVVINHTEPELPAGDRRNLELLRAQLPVPELAELGFGPGDLVPPLDVRAFVAALARV